VLSGGWDATIKLWDTETGALIRTFQNQPQWVNSVAFSPDGARVLLSSDDKTIKLCFAAGVNRRSGSRPFLRPMVGVPANDQRRSALQARC
jgi:WD40 repeat protein